MLLIDRTFVPREGQAPLPHITPNSPSNKGRGSSQNMTFPQALAVGLCQEGSRASGQGCQEMAWASCVHCVLALSLLRFLKSVLFFRLGQLYLILLHLPAFSNPMWLHGLDALENSSLKVLIRPNQEKHKENQKLKSAGTTPPPTPTTLMLLN